MIQAVKPSSDELRALANMLAAIDPFVKLNGRLPLRCVQAYLLVAYHEGLPVGDYAKMARIPQSTMSRTLLDIGDSDRYGGEGHGLVLGRDNPNNRREKEYFLSPKGRALMRNITAKIAG
jgi:DNA-binding MarR family transcriptional regulator